MELRDENGNRLEDDCPCPGMLKGSCLDCPYRAVAWCTNCDKSIGEYKYKEEGDSLVVLCPLCGMVIEVI